MTYLDARLTTQDVRRVSCVLSRVSWVLRPLFFDATLFDIRLNQIHEPV